MKNISIKVVTGNIAEQDADMLVNSSNTYLLLGSGTAKDIRDAGGYLPSDDKEYWNLVDQAKKRNPVLGKVLDYVHSQRLVPSKAQKKRLEYLKGNDFKELMQGDAVLMPSCDLSETPMKADYVSDAIAMTYRWDWQPTPPVIHAYYGAVLDSLYKSLLQAADKGCKSVAIPVMCTRKGGMDNITSSLATVKALENFNRKRTPVRDVSIVLYSEDLQKEEDWFKKFYSSYS